MLQQTSTPSSFPIAGALSQIGSSGVSLRAHTHRAGMATGRRADAPLGFSVGTLTQRDALEYAKTRRATLSWSQAFVWGYVSENSSQLFLCQKQAKEWRLP